MTVKPIPKGTVIKDAITKHLDRRFLSSIDLVGQGVIWLTVDHVEQHDVLEYLNKQKEKNAIVMHFKELNRPLVCKPVHLKPMIYHFKTNVVEEWEGQKIPLFAEPGVYFGKQQYAVRVATHVLDEHVPAE